MKEGGVVMLILGGIRVEEGDGVIIKLYFSVFRRRGKFISL